MLLDLRPLVDAPAAESAPAAAASSTYRLPYGLTPDHVPLDWRKDDEEALLVGVVLATAL